MGFDSYPKLTDSQRKIVEENLKIVYFVIHKHYQNVIHNRSPLANLEDLYSVGCEGLIKAVVRFDLRQENTFFPYAASFIKGEIQHWLRDKVNFVKTPRLVKEHLFVESLDSIKNSKKSAAFLKDCQVGCDYLDSYIRKDFVLWGINQLSPRRKTIVFMRYFLDLNSKEIANRLGIKKQSVDTQFFTIKRSLRRILKEC